MDDQRRQQQAIAALRQQRDALLEALEAAPKPRRRRVGGLWLEPVLWYGDWYNGQRQAALALVEGDEQCQNA